MICFTSKHRSSFAKLTPSRVATVIEPPRTERLLTQAAAHRDRTGRDLLSDVLAAERRAGTRIVHQGAAWTAHVPAAARWPVKLHLQLFSVCRAAGKLKYLAGSESGMGVWLNDTTPDRIARGLRELA